MGLPPFLYYIYILTFISRKWKNLLDIPVEKLGGRDLNEIQEEDLKAQATRRKVLESRFKTATLDPIEVESSPIQESEQTITSLTETVASLGIGETITVTTESSNPTKKTDENTQTSTDTEDPKEDEKEEDKDKDDQEKSDNKKEEYTLETLNVSIRPSTSRGRSRSRHHGHSLSLSRSRSHTCCHCHHTHQSPSPPPPSKDVESSPVHEDVHCSGCKVYSFPPSLLRYI